MTIDVDFLVFHRCEKLFKKRAAVSEKWFDLWSETEPILMH